MISSKDVSVVVQGAIDKKETIICLKSIRKYLPDAEIILSSWENSDVEDLKSFCDKIILSKDPGGFKFGRGEDLNNLKRQLISTQAGLNECNRKYILKFRTDLVLKNNNILKYNNKLKRINKFKLFQNRILTNDIYTFKYITDGTNKCFYPFQISDWWHFGLSEDIKMLFDIPIPQEPEFSEYYMTHKKPEDKFVYWDSLTWQMTPEQYIHSTCAKKYFSEIIFKDFTDTNEIVIRQSEVYVINNFIVLDRDESGINIQKPIYSNMILGNCIEHREDSHYSKIIWVNDYEKYIDKKYTLKQKLNKHSKALYNHFKNLFSYIFHPIIFICKTCVGIISETLSVFSYILKILT